MAVSSTSSCELVPVLKFCNPTLKVSLLALCSSYSKLAPIDSQSTDSADVGSVASRVAINPVGASGKVAFVWMAVAEERSAFFMAMSKDQYYKNIDARIKVFQDFGDRYSDSPFASFASKRVAELKEEKFRSQ